MSEDRAREQAAAQMSSIAQMVAALECDYDRLNELRDERQELKDAVDDADPDELKVAVADLHNWEDINGEELAELEDTAGNCESREAAEERIMEDPLSIEVRSGWHSPGETAEPEEFQILLCTGGPAVRILGELNDYREPIRAWIEYQDWFTPWVEYFGDVDQDVLLTYCRAFYFGG